MKTTVITPTIGTDKLKDAILSVQEQSVRCKHLVVVDGEQYEWRVQDIFDDTNFYGDVIVLPENTGGKWRHFKWNGHRIYAGIPAIVNSDFISFLDEDNWYQPRFVEVMESQGKYIATCRRHIYSHDGAYLGVDNFESIGKNDFGYVLHDTNTLLFDTIYYNTMIAQSFYYPLGADKRIGQRIEKLKNFHKHCEEPLVNYQAPERLTEFFNLNCTK